MRWDEMILQRWISSWTLGVLSTLPASDGLPACTKRRSRMKTWRNTNTSDTRIGNIDVVYDGLRPPFIDYFRVSGFRTGFPHVVLVYHIGYHGAPPSSCGQLCDDLALRSDDVR